MANTPISFLKFGSTNYQLNDKNALHKSLGYSMNGKNYPVQDSDGKLYVNVPWTNTTYTLGGLMGTATKGSSIQPIWWNGSSFVNTSYTLSKSVPADAKFTDTNTTYSASNGLTLSGTSFSLKYATDSERGGIKVSNILSSAVESSTNDSTPGRYYGVQRDSNGLAFVNVPWANDNTTYGAATTATAGLMSSADKSKLDGIASGANAYTHPSYTSKSSGLYKITVDTTGHVSGTTAVDKTDITNLGIPSTNTTYSNATTSAAGLMSKDDKIKLNGIASGANAYTHPSYTSKSSGLYKITVDGTGHVSGATAVAKTDITNLGIPSTNTTYSNATTSIAGLMSTSDKSKLDGIASGANNYSLPTASADTKGGIKIGYEENSNKYAVQLDNGKAFVQVPWTDHEYDLATTGAAGLMSKDDKIKLNGIASGANAYSHPTYTSKSSGLYKITVDGTGHVSGATAVTKADITGLGIPSSDTNTTYSASTGLTLSGTAFSLNTATDSVRGGIKVSNVLSSTVSLTSSNGTTQGRYYGVQRDSNGTAFVNVPWSNDNTTYSASTGLGLSNTAFYLKTAATNEIGGIKVSNVLSSTVSLTSSNGSTQSRYYGVQRDSNGTTFVNVPWTNTTYGAASQSATGLMSSADKKKLDGIASSANAYSHPTYTSKSSGLYKITVDGTGHVSGATAVTKADITGLGIPGSDTNTTYGASTGLTLSGTAFSLKPAASNEIGGIKIGYGAAFANGQFKFGVSLTDDSRMANYQCAYVGIPLVGQWGSSVGLMTSIDKMKLDGLSSNADTVDGYHASKLLHLNGYYSIPGNGDNGSTNFWSKIGSMTFTEAWQQCGASLTFYEWESRRMMGELKFNIRTTSSKSTANASIVWMNLTNKDFESSFIICRTGDGTYNIYFKYPASIYNAVRFYIISQYDDGHLTWQDGSALTSTEPTYVNEKFVSGLTSWVGNADTVDGEHASAFAHRGQANDLITCGNEFNFIKNGQSGQVWFNYQDGNRQSEANISVYSMGNGRGGYASVMASGFKHKDYDSSNYVLTSNGGAVKISSMSVGYASSAGSAPASDVYSWAKSSDLSAGVNTLSEGDSGATPDDYIVAQYSGGGTTHTSYHRRKLSNVFAALRKSNITTALGYTPPTTNTTYSASTGLTLSGTAFSLNTATDSVRGGIKVSNVLSSTVSLTSSNGTTQGRYYGVQRDSNGTAFVNVPWSNDNTTYSASTGLGLSNTAFYLKTASSSTLGGIKTGYGSYGNNYAVKVDSNNNAYVTIPYVDGGGGIDGIMNYYDMAYINDRLDELERQIQQIWDVINGGYYYY